MTKTVMSFVIDRARWANGGIAGDSGLYTSTRQMCCLGFYARACGLKIKQIEGQSYPHSPGIPLPSQMAWLVETPEHAAEMGREAHPGGSAIAYAIATTNDAACTAGLKPITRKEREQAIKTHFARQNITVTFTGRYPAKGK